MIISYNHYSALWAPFFKEGDLVNNVAAAKHLAHYTG